MNIVSQNQYTVQCEVVIHRGQTIEDTSGQGDTEPTECTL